MRTDASALRSRKTLPSLALMAVLAILGCNARSANSATNHANTLAASPDPLSWASISNRWGAVPLDELRKLAESNQASAQYYLGWIYESGKGLPSSESEASKCYQLAADNGFAPAQFLLGARAERQKAPLGNTIVGNFQVASEWYEKAANQGYVPAMVQLGDLYFYGKLGHNYTAADKWFRLAAQKGNEDAILRLGDIYLYNRGDVLQNHAESAKWFRIAAENGNAEAQYQLALLLLNSEQIPRDPAQARVWLEKSAAGGHAKAFVKLSSLPGAGNSRLSQLSRKELESLATGGGGPALLALAIDYEEGRQGPREDYRAAGIYWHILTLNSIFDKDLSKTISEAVHRLVGLYATARVQPSPAPQTSDSQTPIPDYYSYVAPKTAAELAQRLRGTQTLLDQPEDMCLVAEMFYAGKIVPEDRSEAVNWFLKAAKAGSPNAINRIGELWAEGVDGAPDLKEAARWYRRAAGKGFSTAQLHLGLAYQKGQGVERDLGQAWIWLKHAADQGEKTAVPELEQVQAQLTAEQLQQLRTTLSK